mmetsp:Transcript_5116/g.11171  ORF Transcript_5116/g.11171 Transcript_5116/m.11171 type:complete len:92 (-) Transcript_5116:1585-1860(-)
MMAVTSLREFMYAFTQATLITSRWLVGSSRRRMSARCSMARASASFILQPPERVDTAWCGLALPSSLKPTECIVLSTSSLDREARRGSDMI